MYGEVKLAFFVYLWYPKTKVTDFMFLKFHTNNLSSDQMLYQVFFWLETILTPVK